MSVRYNETEYVYISAKVRSLENLLIGRSTLEKMLSAKDADEAFSLLRDAGADVRSDRRYNASEREDTLLGLQKQALLDLKAGLPDANLLKIFEYPYDCANIKSAIKCEIRGIDCAPLLFDIGSVPSDVAVDAVKRRDFSVFPKNMAKAAAEAVDEFNRTGNPQAIDFILDRACFADIDDIAKATNADFVLKYCQARADLKNFIIALRVLRMDCGVYGEKLVGAALVPGGSIDTSDISAAYKRGEDNLFALVSDRYGYIGAKISVGCSLELAEKVCDDCLMDILSSAKMKTYGIEVPFAYVAAIENEIQNVRMITAGKDAGADSDILRERLRESYV